MKLKEYCEKESITMKSIALALGYQYNHFANCIAGRTRLSLERARAVSEYCNGEVTIDDLLPYKKPKYCSDPRCNKVLDRSYW